MSDSAGSGIQQSAPRNGSTVRETLVKIVGGGVLAVLLGTSGMLLAHESRTTVLESGAKAHGEKHDAEAKAREKQYEWTKESLDEIKAKLNKLLEAR